MALVFADSCEQFSGTDGLEARWSEQPTFGCSPKFPGVYSVEALPSGTAIVTREHDGKTEIISLLAGESAWGISWNGASYSVTEDAWEM